MMGDIAARTSVSAQIIGHDDDPAPVLDSHPGRPILVTTRNDDLDGLVADIHPDNLPDLILVQNGLLLPWLVERGLQNVTQGVLYVAVPSVGAPPKSGGESLFWGPHAQDIAGMLTAGGVPARSTPDESVFLRESGIKLLWICVFGLLGEATGLSVGELAREEVGAVRALVAELVPVVDRALDTTLPINAVTSEVLAYARAIPEYRATLKEWEWRNGAVLQVAAELGLQTPRHNGWLRQTSHKG